MCHIHNLLLFIYLIMYVFIYLFIAKCQLSNIPYTATYLAFGFVIHHFLTAIEVCLN